MGNWKPGIELDDALADIDALTFQLTGDLKPFEFASQLPKGLQVYVGQHARIMHVVPAVS